MCLSAEGTLSDLNYLDPFFDELNPPALYGLPVSMTGTTEDISRSNETFEVLASIQL